MGTQPKHRELAGDHTPASRARRNGGGKRRARLELPRRANTGAGRRDRRGSGCERRRTEVSANAEHDEPLGLLSALRVGLGVAQRLDVDRVGLSDLVRGAVADEDGLSTPLREVECCVDSTERVGVRVRLSGCEEAERLVSSGLRTPTTHSSQMLTLMMTFFPSGIDPMSTSTLARARTSAEADMLARKSVTVDLAPAAVMSPIDPTMK